jgi:hypothetical protein
VSDHPFLHSPEERLEEHLQPELDAPGDVALTTSVPEVTVPVIWDPELIHRAEEDTVQRVPCIRFEPNVLALPEERILLDRDVFVVVREAAYRPVLSGRITESGRTIAG